MTARELTEPFALTRAGRLNRDAVGWSRQPIADTSGIGRGRGRNKRWEYWNVTTPTHILALTVSSIDYAAVHEVWVFERATEKTWSRAVTLIPPRGVQLPASLEDGPARARAKGLEIAIDPIFTDGSGVDAAGSRAGAAGSRAGAAGSGVGLAGPGAPGRQTGTRLRARIAGASFDVVAALPPGHERMAVVVPWSDTRFQYTVKDVARPASGTVTIDGVTHPVAAGESWAVLDHGRGRWPYDIRWNWGAGSGRSHGRVIGIQVGGKWTDGTGVTENAVLVDGRLHKIHDELRWDYDVADWPRPWRIDGGGLAAVFTPFHNKVGHTNLGVLSSRTDQCFGFWAGTFTTADGETIAFDGILGWAEEVHNRW